MPFRCAYGCATTLMDSKSFHLAVAMVNARQPKRFDVWMEYKSTLSPRWRRRRWWWWYGVQTLIYYFTEVIEWALECVPVLVRARRSASESHYLVIWQKLLNNSIITVSFKYLNWLQFARVLEHSLRIIVFHHFVGVLFAAKLNPNNMHNTRKLKPFTRFACLRAFIWKQFFEHSMRKLFTNAENHIIFTRDSLFAVVIKYNLSLPSAYAYIVICV